MTALQINLADDVRFRLQARATEGGFDTVEAYVQSMLVADAAGPGTPDAQLEPLLLSRLDGPFVDADAADFQQLRQKLKDRLGDPTPDADRRP